MCKDLFQHSSQTSKILFVVLIKHKKSSSLYSVRIISELYSSMFIIHLLSGRQYSQKIPFKNVKNQDKVFYYFLMHLSRLVEKIRFVDYLKYSCPSFLSKSGYPLQCFWWWFGWARVFFVVWLVGVFLGGGGKEPVSCGAVQFSQKHSVYLEGVKDKMLIAILLTSKKKKNAT